jgi:hypothetical protein
LRHLGHTAIRCIVAKELNSALNELVIVDIAEGLSTELNGKPKLVEPLRNATVDWNLIAGQSGRLREIA